MISNTANPRMIYLYSINSLLPVSLSLSTHALAHSFTHITGRIIILFVFQDSRTSEGSINDRQETRV